MSMKEIYNQRFGRLVALFPLDKRRRECIQWWCRCDCGKEKVVVGINLRNGQTRSCGCLKDERTKQQGLDNKTHGMSKTPEHEAWMHMKDRCYGLKNKKYPRYGGRGIKVCERWKNSFEIFYKDIGPRPSKDYSLDRIDNDGDYCPENCRWATRREQMNNTSKCRNITWNNKTQTITQWAEELGVKFFTLRRRLNSGWSIEKALTTPVRKINKGVST